MSSDPDLGGARQWRFDAIWARCRLGRVREDAVPGYPASMVAPVPHTASPRSIVSGPTMAGLRRRRASIRRLAALHGASNIRVFGSVARGDAGPGSDVDFLVDMAADRRGLALFDALQALQDDLTSALGVGVDVVRVSGSGPAIDAVLREAVPL